MNMISSTLSSILAFIHQFDLHSESLIFLNRGYKVAELGYAYEGLIKTGQPFLGYKDTGFLLLEAVGDDLGQYYFVAKLFHLLNLPSTPQQISFYQMIFYSTIILLSFFIGCFGVSLIYKEKNTRIISYIYLFALSFFCLFILSTYSFYFFIISFIPLILYFINKIAHNNKNIYYFLFALIGLLIGISNKFRIQTGTGILIFIVIYLFLISKKYLAIKNKFIILFILLIFSNFFNLYFSYLMEKRNNWLIKNNYSHLLKADLVNEHPLWHALYLGLAYDRDEKYTGPYTFFVSGLFNKYNLWWDDDCGYKKANEILGYERYNYNYWDRDYENIIKNEFLKILKNDPFFVIKNIILKTKKVLIYVFLSMNIGLIFLFFNKTEKKLLISFLAVILFYIAPGILVWPDPRYFLGGICMSVFLTIFLINDFLVFRQAKSA